jgi:hypothetical protein
MPLLTRANYPDLEKLLTRIPCAKASHRARLQDRIVYGSLVALSILLIAMLLFRLIAH